MPTHHEIFDRFYRALRSGERPEIRDYLDLDPPGDRAELLRDLAFEEMCWRIHLGEPAGADEVLARFPELRAAESELRAEEARCHEETARSGDPPRRPAGPPSVAGPEIPGYGPLERIGWGGMAVVYRAMNRDLRRPEAIKIPHPHLLALDPDLARRFRAEAEAAARFSHPNVARVYRTGEGPAGPFLAMELVEGAPMADWAAEPGRPVAEVVAAVADLAEAVHCVHERGLVHRDINPKNILLRREGDRSVPVLLDFGLAKPSPTGGDGPSRLTVSGTLAFMAPEQIAGRYDERTDVYGLGATLYFLLCGEPPIGTGGRVVGLGERRPGVDPGLEAACMRALAADPRDRQPTARALADDLRAVLRRGPRAGARAWLPRRAVPGRSRRAGIVAARALAVAVVLVAAIAAFRRGPAGVAAGPSAADRAFRRVDGASPGDGGDWRTAAEFPTTDGGSAPPPGIGPARLERGGLVRDAKADAAAVPLGEASGAGIEARVALAAGWDRTEGLGFVLSGGGRPSYRFVLRPMAGAGKSFRDARDRGAFVAAQILRDDVVVREHRWRAPALSDDRLELSAWRDGGRFGFRVGAMRPVLEWVDVAPTIPAGAVARLGLEWPAGVAMAGLRVRARASTPPPDVLAPADALFNAGQFADAAQAYRRAEARSGDPAVAEAARYKRAMSLARARLHPEAAELFAEIARSSGSLSPGDPRRAWGAPAAFQALLLVWSQALASPAAEGLWEILTIDPADGPDPAGDALALLVTEDELSQFIRHTARYAFTTSQYHLLRIAPEQIADLKRAVRALDRLDPSGVSSVGPRQELIRVLLSTGLYGQAQVVADQLLDDRRPIDPEHRLTVTRDAVWLAIEQALEPGAPPATRQEDLNWGLEHVARGLRDPARPGAPRAGCGPLVVEEARLYAALGRREEAARLLDGYLAATDLRAWDFRPQSYGSRFAPPEDVLALYYLEASLLRGFLAEEAGDARKAREIWIRGYDPFRHGHVVTYYEGAMLGSLAGTLDGRDADRMIATTSKGAQMIVATKGGVRPLIDAKLVRTFEDEESRSRLVREIAREVLLRAWRSRRGHDQARGFARRSLTFHESLGVQIKLWAYEAFRRGVLGPPPHGRELDDDEDRALWDLSSAMVDDYRSGRLKEFQLAPLSGFIKGDTTFWEAWEPLRRPPPSGADWRGPLAYVLGCHYRNNLSDPATAARFFRDAARLTPADSPLRGRIDAAIRGDDPGR